MKRKAGRIQVAASKLYSTLLAFQEQGFSRVDLCDIAGVDDHEFPSAMKQARRLAVEDGYMIPSAVPSEGRLYCCTNLPERMFPSLDHHARQIGGIQRTINRQLAFVGQRIGSAASASTVDHFDLLTAASGYVDAGVQEFTSAGMPEN